MTNGRIHKDKFLKGAQEALRPTCGRQVDSLQQVTEEEEFPVEPPSLEDFDLQNPNENEQYRQEMASYAEWKTEAKKRQDIKSALLGKCNEQVKKNMKREHGQTILEDLYLPVTVMLDWIWDAAKDPTVSSAKHRHEAMHSYANARQYSNETLEEWGERYERLVTECRAAGLTIEDAEAANQFILKLDAGRFSPAIERHEEHLNMVRPEGCHEGTWQALTQPVHTLEEAIVKVRLSKQIRVDHHIVNMVEKKGPKQKKGAPANAPSQDYSSEEEQTKKKKLIKKKREDKSQGEREDRKCHLCDGPHLMRNCPALDECREIARKQKQKEKIGKSKGMKKKLLQALLKEDSDDSIDLSFAIETVAMTLEEDKMLFDTGASVSITPDPMGYTIVDLPHISVRSLSGTKALKQGIIHPVFGPFYIDKKAPFRILAAGSILRNPGFQADAGPDGTYHITSVKDGTTYATEWRKNVMILHTAGQQATP